MCATMIAYKPPVQTHFRVWVYLPSFHLRSFLSDVAERVIEPLQLVGGVGHVGRQFVGVVVQVGVQDDYSQIVTKLRVVSTYRYMRLYTSFSALMHSCSQTCKPLLKVSPFSAEASHGDHLN